MLNTTSRRDAIISATHRDIDVQGIDWSEAGTTRGEALNQIDTRYARFQHFSYLRRGPCYAPASGTTDRYMHIQQYIKLDTMSTAHFQLRYALLALSPYDVVYSSRAGLEHLNVQSMTKTRLLTSSIKCVDYKDNMLIAGHGERISVIDMDTAQVVKSWKFGPDFTEAVGTVRFFKGLGGLKAAAGGNIKKVEVYDIERPESLLASIASTEYVNYVTTTDDYNLAAFVTDGRDVEIADLREMKVVHMLKGHGDSNFCADFHRDGTTLATGGEDCSVKLWDLRKMDHFKTLPTKKYAAYCLKYMNNYKHLVVSENSTYVTAFKTDYDCQVSSTIDFFGKPVGMDQIKGTNQMYLGIDSNIQNLASGLMKCQLT